MNKSQPLLENLVKRVLFIFSVTAAFILALIIFFLFREAIPLFNQTSPIDFLTGTRWVPSQDIYGALPFIIGTFTITAGALVLASPLGIACALFLAEVSPRWARNLTRPAIELLAGIPSVVYGLLAMVILVRFLKLTFGLPTGETLLAGSIILAIMILPTIISVSQDSIESVPRALKEGSYAVGSTDWQTMRKIILPTAMPGILASIILGTGRAIGETMAVVLVIGNTELIPDSLLKPGAALTSGILLEMPEAVVGSMHYSALFSLGALLFTIVFTLSLISNHILSRRVM